MTFQFITSINTIDRDAETRRKVRSHARRQKLPHGPAGPAQGAAPNKPSTQKDRTSKFRLGSSVKAPPKSRKARPGSSTATASSASSASSASDRGSSPSQSRSSSATDDLAVAETRSGYETTMITNDLGFTVVRELPPFSTLPIQTTPLTENLFKYIICVCLSPKEKFVQKWFDRCGAPSYFSVHHSSFLANSHAMNPSGDLMGFLSIDPAMTHAFMAMIAAMHNALADWDDMTTIDFHRHEAIQLINKRLNSEGRSLSIPVSDGVMVSVSLLVQIEVFIGSLQSAKAHMNGLVKMVELRGGLLQGLGYSTLLQRALCWADFAYASASASPLTFPLVPALANSLSPQDRFTTRSNKLHLSPSRFGPQSLDIRHPEALELFELLFSATEAVNSFEFSRLEDLREQRGQMSDTVYVIEHRLCNFEEASRSRLLRKDGCSMVSCTSPTDLSDALAYASHLFLHLALRGQPPGAKRHRVLTEALMMRLSCTLMYKGWLLDDSVDESLESIKMSPWSSGDDISSSPVPSSVGDCSPPPPAPLDAVHDWYINPASPEPTPSQSATPPATDELHDDILMWILFIGSCVQMRIPPANDGALDWPGLGSDPQTSLDAAFLSRNHRAFFVLALKRVCRSRGIADKETLIDKLRAVIWLNTWCERQMDLVWAQMGLELTV